MDTATIIIVAFIIGLVRAVLETKNEDF
jgi:hypothetical protein